MQDTNELKTLRRSRLFEPKSTLCPTTPATHIYSFTAENFFRTRGTVTFDVSKEQRNFGNNKPCVPTYSQPRNYDSSATFKIA
jgi:hypothetical protein